MRRILRLCLGLAVSMAFVAPAFAELAMTGAPVAMRAGPSGKAALVQRVPQRAEIELEKCTHSWCRASWRGRSGYVPADAVALGSPPTALPGGKMPPPVVNAPADAARAAWRWTGPYVGVNGGFGSSSWQR
jgi:hypothetical protein